MSVTGTGAIATKAFTVAATGALIPGSTIFQNPSTPNIVDFLIFLSTSVQIPSVDLPASSPYPQFALTQALDLIPTDAPMPSPPLYTLAVYNCATHIIFQITPDQQGQTFFTNARSRAGFSLMNPSTGLVQASSDNGTSSTLSSPDWAKGLTVGQLDFYKTPWGRYYLSYIQSYGPTIVGLT